MQLLLPFIPFILVYTRINSSKLLMILDSLNDYLNFSFFDILLSWRNPIFTWLGKTLQFQSDRPSSRIGFDWSYILLGFLIPHMLECYTRILISSFIISGWKFYDWKKKNQPKIIFLLSGFMVPHWKVYNWKKINSSWSVGIPLAFFHLCIGDESVNWNHSSMSLRWNSILWLILY